MADDANPPSPFDVQTIKHLVASMSRHDLSEIDLRDGQARLRLRRGPRRVVASSTPVPAPVPVVVSAPATAQPPVPAPRSEPSKPAKALIEIKSPTPGTFYAKPNPQSPPFVTVGSRVTPTTVVCTIEAMKIYNEISAECSGVIAEIVAEDGKPVEWGTVLFRVDPTG